jgi:hypothetical protein
MHHSCCTNLWKYAGGRPPKVGTPISQRRRHAFARCNIPHLSELLFKGSVVQVRL